MTTYATTLEAREEIAEGTMAFHLRKPSGFDFKPGQAIDVILTSKANAPEDPSTRHTFSIVTAPFEDDLVVATRMRDSAYKRALKAMTVGSPVTIDGPSGSLGLHKDPLAPPAWSKPCDRPCMARGSMTTTFAVRSSTVTETMHNAALSIEPIVSPSTSDADVGLAARAANGDEAAFGAIMRRHNRLLFRTARSILKNDAEAEDALQEAYLRAWRALASFHADAKLSTWLVRIVINESLTRLRRRGAQVIPLDASMEESEHQTEAWMEDDPDQRPDRAAMRSEVRRLMEARIDTLPDAFRTVFMLRAVEELSVEEVAVVLEIPEATVRTRFFRARGLLREGLSRDVDLAIGDAFSFAGARCARIVASVLSKLESDRESPRS